jgi:hypothetical protein
MEVSVKLHALAVLPPEKVLRVLIGQAAACTPNRSVFFGEGNPSNRLQTQKSNNLLRNGAVGT